MEAFNTDPLETPEATRAPVAPNAIPELASVKAEFGKFMNDADLD